MKNETIASNSTNVLSAKETPIPYVRKRIYYDPEDPTFQIARLYRNTYNPEEELYIFPTPERYKLFATSIKNNTEWYITFCCLSHVPYKWKDAKQFIADRTANDLSRTIELLKTSESDIKPLLRSIESDVYDLNILATKHGAKVPFKDLPPLQFESIEDKRAYFIHWLMNSYGIDVDAKLKNENR
jgi:hypothetical protein